MTAHFVPPLARTLPALVLEAAKRHGERIFIEDGDTRIDYASLPARVFVPSALLQGASAEWENPGRGLQLQASTGEPGRLDFLPANGFRRLPGQRTAFGGQWRLGADEANPLATQGWTLALRHEDGRRVSVLDTPAQPNDTVNADSTLLALRREDAGYRLQGQLMSTRSSQFSGSRSGFWFDGEWDDGPRTHGLGAYRLQPDLSWANLPMANDLVGAYARTAWRTRQWSAEGSIDWLDSLSGRSGSGTFATGSARWRLNRDHSLGAGATLRRFDGDAWSTWGDWRFQNGWGTTGLRLELTHGQGEPDSRWLSWDQEWAAQQGWAISTSLGLRRYDAFQAQPAENAWNAALSLSAPLGNRAGLRGNLASVVNSLHDLMIGTEPDLTFLVDLDPERRAQMVSNLLVVLCSERGTQPVVNAGSVY